MAIKYEYNYNEYTGSKNATDISHVLNTILALFYPIIGIGNIVAIFLLGMSVAETFDLGIDSLWPGLIIFLIAAVVDILLISLKIGIDIICEQVVIRENYKEKPEEIKKVALKNNLSVNLDSLWSTIKMILVHTPLIAVAISAVVAIFCSFGSNRIPILVISLIALIADVFVLLFIRKRL